MEFRHLAVVYAHKMRPAGLQDELVNVYGTGFRPVLSILSPDRYLWHESIRGKGFVVLTVSPMSSYHKVCPTPTFRWLIEEPSKIGAQTLRRCLDVVPSRRNWEGFNIGLAVVAARNPYLRRSTSMMSLRTSSNPFGPRSVVGGSVGHPKSHALVPSLIDCTVAPAVARSVYFTAFGKLLPSEGVEI